MRQIKALYLANAREFFRARMAIILILTLPVALVIFFGLLFDGGDGGWALHLGIVNEDVGSAGRQFAEELASGAAEAIDVHSGDRSEMLAALNAGEVGIVLVLPTNMTTALGTGQPVIVEVIYDATQRSTSAAGISMVRTILSEANLALSGASEVLVMQERSVQTDPPRNIDLYMPGMLGIALLWLGLFGTAMPLMQQRTGQVLRRLSVTPLRPATMLTAQVGWRVTVGLLQAAIFSAVGYLAFGVVVEGNVLLFVAVVTLGALVFVGLGYVLAGMATSEEGLMAMTQLANMPMMFLSGGLIPIETLPSFFRPLANILPLTYLTDALGQVMVGATPMNPFWLNLSVLGGWLAVLLFLGVRFWRWE